MSDNLPHPAQNQDSFDTAVRGYNRQQVSEYMSRSSKLIATLEKNLAVARADVQRARSDAERARVESERLRSAPVEVKSPHEELSARMSQILQLATEEAEQERANADAEITKLRDDSRVESERLIDEARAQSEQVLAEARETAERELADARATAAEDLRSAREEADRIRQESEQHSAEVLDDAQRRAGAVNEVSDQRLETLTATHGEAVLRLGQIRDVLADLLDRDAAAGSLAQVVEAVMAPPGSLQPEFDAEPLDDLEPLPEGAEFEPVDAELLAEEPVDEPVDEQQHQPEDGGREPEDGPADPDQTSVVPAVQQTAVHEPIQDAVRTREDDDTVVQANVHDQTVDYKIDLRDQVEDTRESGVPTRR